MEPKLVEPSVFGIQHFEETWFQRSAFDDRYQSTDYVAFYPSSAITNSIEFILPPHKNGAIYQIQDALIAVNVKLTKKDGTALDATSQTALVNNSLHSIFDDCKVLINGVQVNPNSRYYNMKAYFSNLLGTNKLLKFTLLGTEAFFMDDAKLIENSAAPGFQSRRKMFRDAANEKYTTLDCPMIARLQHDLVTTSAGLPPNCEVRVILTQSSNNFAIQSFDNSDEGTPTTDPDYIFTVSRAVLHMPTSLMEPKVYSRFLEKISKEPCNLFFRRFVCNVTPIPLASTIYSSDNIYPRNESPCRVFVAIVETNKLIGTQKTSPYNFLRKWTTTSTSSVRVRRPTDQPTGSRIGNMLRPTPADHEEFVEQIETTEKTVYIKRIYLTLNGREITSLAQESATEQHDLENYLKFLQTCGTSQLTGFSAGVSISNYLNGMFVAAFDLSTSLESFDPLIVPALKLGYIRLNLEFSDPLATNLSLVTLSEFPSLLTISSSGKVALSFPH